MADRIQEIVARIRLLVTTPGPENVTQALRLLAATAADRRMLDRYAASWLASCHPVDALAVAFTGGSGAGGASEELRACLVHELVLRGWSSPSCRESRAHQHCRRRAALSRRVDNEYHST